MLIVVISRAYDRAAIKFRGVDADINFNLCDYEEDMNQVFITIHNLVDSIQQSTSLFLLCSCCIIIADQESFQRRIRALTKAP